MTLLKREESINKDKSKVFFQLTREVCVLNENYKSRTKTRSMELLSVVSKIKLLDFACLRLFTFLAYGIRHFVVSS